MWPPNQTVTSKRRSPAHAAQHGSTVFLCAITSAPSSRPHLWTRAQEAQQDSILSFERQLDEATSREWAADKGRLLGAIAPYTGLGGGGARARQRGGAGRHSDGGRGGRAAACRSACVWGSGGAGRAQLLGSSPRVGAARVPERLALGRRAARLTCLCPLPASAPAGAGQLSFGTVAPRAADAQGGRMSAKEQAYVQVRAAARGRAFAPQRAAGERAHATGCLITPYSRPLACRALARHTHPPPHTHQRTHIRTFCLSRAAQVVKRLNAAAHRRELSDAVAEFGAACAATEDRPGGERRERACYALRKGASAAGC